MAKTSSAQRELAGIRDQYVEICRAELAGAQPGTSVTAELTLIEDGEPVGAVAIHSPAGLSRIKPSVEEFVEAIRERQPEQVVLVTPCRWVPESHHSVYLAVIDRTGETAGAVLYIARKRYPKEPIVVTVPRSHPAIYPILRPLQAAMKTIS